MKKIFFFLCIVLLVLFMPAYAHGLDNTPLHGYEVIKHNQLYISNSAQNKTPTFDSIFLAEDQDDIGNTERTKAPSVKNLVAIASFLNLQFNHGFENKSAFHHFINYPQPISIYCRVLRL